MAKKRPPKPEWWQVTRAVIRAYPRWKSIKEPPPGIQGAVKAVDGVLEEWANRDELMPAYNMMVMYHIRRSHTLDGAAFAVGYSHERAVWYNRRFVTAVAVALGLLRAPEVRRAGEAE